MNLETVNIYKKGPTWHILGFMHDTPPPNKFSYDAHFTDSIKQKREKKKREMRRKIGK